MANIFNQVRLAQQAQVQKDSEAKREKQMREQLADTENNRSLRNKIRDEMRTESREAASVKGASSHHQDAGDEDMEYGEYAEGEEESYQEAGPSVQRQKRGRGAGKQKVQPPGLRRCAPKVSIQETWKRLGGCNKILPNIPQSQYPDYFRGLRGASLRDYRDLFKELLTGQQNLVSDDERKIFARNKLQVSKLTNARTKHQLREAWVGSNKKLSSAIINMIHSLEPLPKHKGKGKGRGKRSRSQEEYDEDEQDEEDEEQYSEGEEDEEDYEEGY